MQLQSRRQWSENREPEMHHLSGLPQTQRACGHLQLFVDLK